MKREVPTAHHINFRTTEEISNNYFQTHRRNDDETEVKLPTFQFPGMGVGYLIRRNKIANQKVKHTWVTENFQTGL